MADPWDSDPIAGPMLRPAIKTPSGIRVGDAGDSHDDLGEGGEKPPESRRGFVDSRGNFLDREQAANVAKGAGLDVPDKLHSSDLAKAMPWEKDPAVPSPVARFMSGQSGPDTRSIPERVGEGARDPLEGSAQLLARIVPAPVERGINAANNWLADKTGLVARLPEGGMDEYERQREAEIQRERGGAAGTTDWWRIAGNVLSPMNYVPAARLGAGGNALARIGTAALGGAMANAEQPVTQGDFWSEKAKQAAIGAVAGGAIGAAAEGVSRGVSAFGRYLSRNFPDSLLHRAVQAVLSRIDADAAAGGPTAQQALDLLNTARTANKPLTLADVGGENVKGLAGYVARQPGESRNIARTVLMGRDEGAAARLGQDVSKYVSSGPSMQQTTEALIEARSKAAAPLYEQAFSANQAVVSPEVNRVLSTPAGQKAVGAARVKMQNDFAQIGHGAVPESEAAFINGQFVAGQPAQPASLTLRTLDYVKRSLDDQIGSAVKAGEKDNARILIGLKKTLVDALDKADTTGAYARARAAYSGPSQSLEALEAGHAIFKTSPEEIAAQFAKLSQNDQEFYRLGVADVLRKRIAETGFGGNEARAIIKNAWTREQLRPVFRSDAEFDRFTDAVMAEHTMAETTTRLLRGSQTAERLAEDTSAGNRALHSAASLARDMASGNWLRALASGYRLKRDLGLKDNPALNTEIARILFAPNLPATGTAGLRLLGAFPGPATRNLLARPAQAIRQSGPFLAPGAALGTRPYYQP